MVPNLDDLLIDVVHRLESDWSSPVYLSFPSKG